MGKVQTKLRTCRLQIFSLFILLASAWSILPTRFWWKRQDAATPIENGAEEEDSSKIELKKSSHKVCRKRQERFCVYIWIASFGHSTGNHE